MWVLTTVRERIRKQLIILYMLYVNAEDPRTDFRGGGLLALQSLPPPQILYEYTYIYIYIVICVYIYIYREREMYTYYCYHC